MLNKQYKASLSKGRNSWCVIFRHPVCKASDGKQSLRVRRGLGTSDEHEAQKLIDQLNEILADESLWNISAKEPLSIRYDKRIISAFFDNISSEKYDPWNDRENYLPLPKNTDGYVQVQFIGTTGAGKTTLVRQIIGTDPVNERFPSISAAKTTMCDIEIIIRDDDHYESVVSFIPKDRVRQYIAECVTNAIFSKLDGDSDNEAYRRFLEHNEQNFRLSYLLGSPHTLKNTGSKESLDDYEKDEEDTLSNLDCTLIDEQEKGELLQKIESYFATIIQLSKQAQTYCDNRATELGISFKNATPADKEVIYEFVEDDIYNDETFHELVDNILEEVESKFDMFESGDFEKNKTGWPILWKHKESHRELFIKLVNRFSSNYAPNFGHLLTPLVDGIRVAGPFKPTWYNGEGNKLPKLVLLDGRGIGHTADSTSSLSTSITRHFKMVDAIVLVDNAAQPMQAAPCAVLRTVVSSGHEGKLIIALTHFDEVKGDNLINSQSRKDHVIGSFDNAIYSISKDFGREAEIALRAIADKNIFFFSDTQKEIEKTPKFTLSQLSKFIQAIYNKVAPEIPSQYSPVYDVANLVFAIQKATQEFHDRWHGILGMGSKSSITPAHWASIKALTRRLGLLRMDEYNTLHPVADLIILLQGKISVYLNNPLEWNPFMPHDSQLKIMIIDKIRKELFNRLHELSSRRVLEEQINEWRKAYEHRGSGSTRTRSRDMINIYENAAPIPNEMPEPETVEFLFELREMISSVIEENGGKLRGWTRNG